MMIDDLNNEMLREILCRLPCYRTALGCKAVSKRWYALISDPLFVTQGFLTNREVIEKEPSFIFLLTMIMWDKNYATAMVAPPRTTTLRSPILSLQFLPYNSRPVATFKDFILTFGVNPLTSLGMYHICNPLTKQWTVLPPPQTDQKQVIWAALTYRDGRDFRVVVAYSQPKPKGSSIIINLLVYLSEICQWRNTDVIIQLKPFNYYEGGYFKGTVCNKLMLCIQVGKIGSLSGRYRPIFGGFNPFDVTDQFYGTLTAIDLSLPDNSAYTFLESDGKLVACQDDTCISFVPDDKGKLIQYFSRPWRSWKCDVGLENDEQLHQWELISEHYGYSDVYGSLFNDRTNSGSCDLRVVGVHPTNEHLVYFIRRGDDIPQNRLILFDTKSKTFEALTTTLLPHEIRNFYKLDIPSWPTPIPIP